MSKNTDTTGMPIYRPAPDVAQSRWLCDTGLPYNTIGTDDGSPVVFSAGPDAPLDDDDRRMWDDATRRLTACANACRGIPTEELEGLARITTESGRLDQLSNRAIAAANRAFRKEIEELVKAQKRGPAVPR